MKTYQLGTCGDRILTVKKSGDEHIVTIKVKDSDTKFIELPRSTKTVSYFILFYYAALLPRRGRVALCLSVRLSVRPVIISVTSRHLANYNDIHVLFGMHRGPHIVRPSRPHKLV